MKFIVDSSEFHIFSQWFFEYFIFILYSSVSYTYNSYIIYQYVIANMLMSRFSNMNIFRFSRRVNTLRVRKGFGRIVKYEL